MTETQAPPATLSLDKVLASVQVTHAQGIQLLYALAQSIRDTNPDITSALYAGADSLAGTTASNTPTSFHTRGGRTKDDD